MPPALYFADKMKQSLNTRTEYILHFEQSLLLEAISGWECTPFTSTTFNYWWQEWSQHIFNEPVSTYCSPLDLDFHAAPKVCLYTLYFQIFISQNTSIHFNYS